MPESGPLEARVLQLEQDLQRFQEELDRTRLTAESASRARDEFLANVSHEIRTPMNAILGMTELALDAAESSRQRELLATVKLAARSLLQVINDLLDFSQIATGKLSLDLTDFSLRAVIGESVRALSARARRKGLELACTIDRDVPDVYIGDARRLRQVLTNLIGNAIKFTARGSVGVEVVRDPDAFGDDQVIQLRFIVRDTGIGIAPEKHAAIFRAFDQEDTSTTRRFGGTGLGLAISAQIAELMGGRITLDSAVGRGSTFIFAARFPRSTRTGWTGSLDNVVALVVDHDEGDRTLLLEWFANWRIRAEAVADATAALAALERTSHSLVLLDAQLPDVDGLTLGMQIRERFAAAAPKLILLSSDDRPDLAALSRDAGIDACLFKPAQPSELLDTIWAVMNMPADTNAGRVEATRRARPLHILVAEDNDLNVAVLLELLHRRGHRVEVAGDGRIALDLACREGAAYDVMLLDLHMPELDGFEVVQAIRESERGTAHHLPIIALTARSSQRDRERALAAGMDDFLSKPIQVEALWDALERATSANRAEQDGGRW